MDWLLVTANFLFGLGNAIYSIGIGEWLPLILLLGASTALVFRRHFPWLVLAAVVVGDVLTVLFTSTGSSSIGMWLAVYTVATTVRALHALVAAVLAGAPLLVAMGFSMPAEIAESIASGELPPYIGLISGVVIMLFNVIAAGIGITVRRDRHPHHDFVGVAESHREDRVQLFAFGHEPPAIPLAAGDAALRFPGEGAAVSAALVAEAEQDPRLRIRRLRGDEPGIRLFRQWIQEHAGRDCWRRPHRQCTNLYFRTRLHRCAALVLSVHG